MEYKVVKSSFGNLDHEDIYLNNFKISVNNAIDRGFNLVGQMIINTDSNGNGCYYQTMIKKENNEILR